MHYICYYNINEKEIEQIQSFNRQIREAVENTFGFAPPAFSIVILETGSQGLALFDAAFRVNGKGYSWNRFAQGGAVLRNADYDF